MADDDGDLAAATTNMSRMRISMRVAPGPPNSIPVPCRFYLAGHCANGDECRFEHPPRAPRVQAPTPPLSRTFAPPPPPPPLSSAFSIANSFAPPRASDFIVRPGVVNAPPSYVGFSAAYASVFDEDDEDDTDALLRAASSPATAASAFLTTVHTANNSSYAAIAAPEDGALAYSPHATTLPVTSAAAGLAPPAPGWGAPPISNAIISSPSSTASPSVSGDLRSIGGALCRYHLQGECRYGERCRYVHGARCDQCGQNALHPTDSVEAALHTESCSNELDRKQRLKSSEHVECGICYERPVASRRKFGLLQNCDHAFCLSCIREWRGAESVGTFGREAVRVCPVCRTESFLVIPSATYESDKAVRDDLLERYKQKLSSIPCKHFDYGRGECPFGGSCMYAHMDVDGNPVAAPDRPPLLMSDSGVRVKTHARLADYLPPAR